MQSQKNLHNSRDDLIELEENRQPNSAKKEILELVNEYCDDEVVIQK
jgi:hypothetical protein